jgi:uncharacterized protein YjeT (DUF2065 family)
MLLLLVVDGYLYCTTVAFKKMHEAGICLDLSDDRRSGSCLVTMCVSACWWVRVPSSIDACRSTPTIRAYKAAAW